MPIGINHIESVNVYIIEDGDSVTLVDCGMWHPGEPDDGLSILRHALNSRGYVLDDIARIIVTHAHIDHYGMAGRLMELTGAQLFMHAMTDLDCESTAIPRPPRRESATPTAITGCPRRGARLRRHPRRLAAVPAFRGRASTRLNGGEVLSIGTRQWEVLTPPDTHSVISACGRRRQTPLLGDHLLPAVTPPSPSSADSTEIPSAAIWHLCSLSPSVTRRLVMPGHGRAFADGRAASMRYAQQTTPARRDPHHDPQPPLHRP
jgi:glyoxylase-like metal-dependent hydrolase (beta-lactamase superfamily II)